MHSIGFSASDAADRVFLFIAAISVVLLLLITSQVFKGEIWTF